MGNGKRERADLVSSSDLEPATKWKSEHGAEDFFVRDVDKESYEEGGW